MMAATTDALTLDMFDFNAKAAPEPQNLPPPAKPNDGGILARIETAAYMGDLTAVQSLYQELKGLPEASYWTEDPKSLSTALLLAVENRRRDVTEFLLEQGVRPSIKHARCAAQRGDTDLLELLLKHGWDINETEDWCLAPLLGDMIQDYNLTVFFLSHGADPNGKAVLDKTPLSEAVRFAPFPTIKLMFDYGGSISVGQLLHWAVHRTRSDTLEIMDFLLQQGAAINKIRYEDSAESYAAEILSGLGTPLHEAASNGDLQTTRFLIERGAHPLIEDSLGGTPLQSAEKAGYVDVVAYLRPITMASSPAEHQFTRGRRVPGWERYYATVRSDERP